MELLQDAVVVLLNVTLFGMGFMFLYRVWRKIIALVQLQDRFWVMSWSAPYELPGGVTKSFVNGHRVALSIAQKVS